MAQDDDFIIGGRKTRKSSSQGSPRPSTSKGGSASQPIVKLGTLSGGSMSFTKRLAKDMAIAKRSSGRKSYAKPSKPRTGRFNARGRGRSALAAGIGSNRSWQTFYNVYSLSGQLIHVHDEHPLDGGLPERTDYITAGGMSIARVRAGQGIHYDHSDHLGSPAAQTYTNGGIATRMRYTPFGLTMDDPNLLKDQAGFTGHIKDSATGLNYMQARYYDPVMGRFLSVDPVTFMDSGNPAMFNRYGYAFNDPVNMIDPDGRVALNSASGAAVGCAVSGPACPAGATVGAVVGAVALGVTALVIANEISENANEGSSGNDGATEGADPVGEILEGASPGTETKGRTKNYDKPGGQSQADEDFEHITEPGTITDRGEGLRTGSTPDGRNTNVRPNSSDGRPTVEVQEGKNKIKIRYDD